MCHLEKKRTFITKADVEKKMLIFHRSFTYYFSELQTPIKLFFAKYLWVFCDFSKYRKPLPPFLYSTYGQAQHSKKLPLLLPHFLMVVRFTVFLFAPVSQNFAANSRTYYRDTIFPYCWLNSSPTLLAHHLFL